MAGSPQGKRYTIRGGGYAAIVAEVGASLAELTTVDGKHIVLPTPEGGIRQGQSGATLAPWVNRIDHGHYRFRDVEYDLPWAEPEHQNAIHGLVNWQRWRCERLTEAGLTLSIDIVPLPGYPFSVHLENTYSVDERGLSWTIVATNTGDETAPYGNAVHPYLVPPTAVISEGSIDGWTLAFPSARHVVVNDHLIPLTYENVAGTDHDFHHGATLDGRTLDDAYELESNPAAVVLSDSAGSATVLEIVDGANWLQVYTDGKHRRAVALEPQTAPANAFNSGIGLIELPPHAPHTTVLRIHAG